MKIYMMTDLEGVAGVVMRIVAAGYNPVTAVPYVSR